VVFITCVVVRDWGGWGCSFGDCVAVARDAPQGLTRRPRLCPTHVALRPATPICPCTGKPQRAGLSRRWPQHRHTSNERPGVRASNANVPTITARTDVIPATASPWPAGRWRSIAWRCIGVAFPYLRGCLGLGWLGLAFGRNPEGTCGEGGATVLERWHPCRHGFLGRRDVGGVSRAFSPVWEWATGSLGLRPRLV